MTALFPRQRPSRHVYRCRHSGPTGGVGILSLLPGLRSFRTRRGNSQVSPRKQAAGVLTPLPGAPPVSPAHLHESTASGFCGAPAAWHAPALPSTHQLPWS